MNIDGKGGGTATVSMSVASDVLAARTETGPDRAATPWAWTLPVYADITRRLPREARRRARRHGDVVRQERRPPAAQTLECSLAFADLKGMSWVLNDVSGALGGAGLGIARGRRRQPGAALTQYNFPSAAEEGDAPTPTAEQSQRQTELATTLMRRHRRTGHQAEVTVPGDVVRSNAPKVDGRTSTWAINAGNMMNQQDVSPEIVFSGQGTGHQGDGVVRR